MREAGKWFLIGVGCVAIGYSVYWVLDRVTLFVVTREDINSLLETDGE